uniref:PH domain-containing protein n=1 Tax=Panagrellus redivivus TaxID=6233 RepID=A0A7E4V442_PANRE
MLQAQFDAGVTSATGWTRASTYVFRLARYNDDGDKKDDDTQAWKSHRVDCHQTLLFISIVIMMHWLDRCKQTVSNGGSLSWDGVIDLRDMEASTTPSFQVAPVPPVPYPPGGGGAASRLSMPPSSSLLTHFLQSRNPHQLNADQLFSVSDYEIITELHSALTRIKEIFNNPSYVESSTDQSVVELTLARMTSAIRETCCIETYAPALVDVLDSCLTHKMYIVAANGQILDSPHCRIASEILSSLFLHHSKKSVMTVAIPVAIKALSCGNQELVRSTSSYLSLAAINNGKLLAQYAVQIISNIIHGNYGLVRVLPQVYPENREPFHAHLSPLFRLLSAPAIDTSEKLSLLQLASMIANTKPDLIIPHLSNFEDFLQHSTTCTAVLHIYLSLISMGRVSALSSQLLPIKRSLRSHAHSQNNLITMGKILGHIGRTGSEMAVLAVPDLIELCSKSNSSNLPILLKELESIAEIFPSSVQHHIELIGVLCEKPGGNTAVYKRIRAMSKASEQPPEPRHGSRASSSGRVLPAQSVESLQSKRSSRILPNDPAPPPPTTTTIFNVNDLNTYAVNGSQAQQLITELDRNMKTLADMYKMRSSGSLGHPRTPSFISIGHGPSIASNANNQNASQHGSRQPSARATPVDRMPPQIPSLTNIQMASSVQIGKDGRVRAKRPEVTSNAFRALPPGFETTFPVADSSPVTKTSTTHLSKTPPRLTPTKSRMHSADTVKTSSTDWDAERGDVVKQFVDHRRAKIRRYITEITAKYPIPLKCTIEGSKPSKAKMRVHFACQTREHQYCLYSGRELFAFKTAIPAVWIHLMFLQSESTSIETTNKVLSQESDEFKTLAHCWSCLPKDTAKSREFVTLVTSAFPAAKEQDLMLKELQDARYFDSFSFNSTTHKWSCFSCAHPDKVKSIIRSDKSNQPLLEGQLKEKKGKWKFLRRWHTKYFTLSSGALSFTENNLEPANIQDKAAGPSIDLRNIRSVKSLSKGRQSRKSLPRAFEIFTEDEKSYVLKASDRSKAEEWFQCLQIAVANAQREKRHKL